MLSLMKSGGVGFLVALLATPWWIRFVQSRSLGQAIADQSPLWRARPACRRRQRLLPQRFCWHSATQRTRRWTG